MEKNLWKWKIG